MDNYTLCLLGWYFGIFPGDVESHGYTQEDIDKAQAHCTERHVDPEEYWMEVAENEIHFG